VSLGNKQAGFTIIEIIIVIPIVSFLVVVLVTLMVRSFYTIQANNTETTLHLESQNLLFKLEDELLFTTEYGETKNSDLVDSHQPSGGWNYNTSPDTLILKETALDAPRRDPNRDFVYREVYTCGSGFSIYNPIAIDNVIYFTEPNSNNSRHTLYRRVLIGQYDTCGTNYRGQTCPSDVDIGTGGCVRLDNKLSDDVVDFKIEYYDEDNVLINTDSGGTPLAGEKVRVTLILGSTVYGNDVEVETSLTMRKIN